MSENQNTAAKVSGSALLHEMQATRLAVEKQTLAIENQTKMLSRLLAHLQSGVNTARPTTPIQQPVPQQPQVAQKPTIGNPMGGQPQGPIYPSMQGNKQPANSFIPQGQQQSNIHVPEGVSGIEPPAWMNEPTATDINPNAV
jgi:hypothetical protein